MMVTTATNVTPPPLPYQPSRSSSSTVPTAGRRSTPQPVSNIFSSPRQLSVSARDIVLEHIR
jgi:hypothetical protein